MMNKNCPQITAKLFALPNADRITKKIYDQLLRVIPKQKKLQLAKFYKREDACRSLVGEALSRYVILHTTGINLINIPYLVSEYGKPYFANIGVHINISHSGRWVICGIDNQEMGVDIEKITTIDLSISERFFFKS